MAPGIFSNSPLPSIYHPQTKSTESIDGYDILDSEDILEPIAVVGLSLKFPDDATTPESFWKLLLEKRCASREMPEDRANMEAFYHPNGSRPDACDAQGGHFVSEDLGAFDAPFFSISSSEAASMDPQHRILLETAYRALENAGIPLKEAAGTKTGVYTGSFADDYKIMNLRDPDLIPKNAVTGGSLTMLAARLSWFFDFKGPCVNLDTACSSSMVALDQACQALRNGECSMALVGGANTIHGLESWLSLSNMGFLSPDGRCYSFDHRANGYARGEGFGVVVLKPLALAIQNQDTIRGIIRATGSNQDGRTPGITQPSGESQEALIRATYAKAGLDPRVTRFFEAHGTGTALGDPTECAAIASVFGPHRTNDEPLYIGAVKSNIGHLEGASGIAGLIKALLALEKGVIPPNTNFERLNPRINAVGMHLAFPTTFEPFPTTGLRRASVNSFGFGGTNSHAVLDDVYHFLQLRGLKANHCTMPRPPSLEELSNTPLSVISPPNPETNPPRTSSIKLLVLSSFDKGGIERQAQAYSFHFNAISPLDENYIDRLAYTLTSRRTHFAWRSFILCSSSDQLTEIENIISEPVQTSKKLGLAMVFTGQGSQYAAMGQQLIEFPVFRRTLLQAQDILYGFGCHWSLVEELLKPEDTSNIDSPALSQPLCTALQCALVELLRSVNVFPLAVVGHSSGEIAAAYAAGFLSLTAAMKVAYFRGVAASRLLEQGSKDGAMLAVGLGHDELLPYLQDLDTVSIACYNGPRSVTASGYRNQILLLQNKLDKDNIFNRLLKVQIAYHSESMKDISEFYLSSLGGDKLLELGSSQDNPTTMLSSVYVKKVSTDSDSAVRNPQYWVDNLVNPVKFEQALTLLLSLSDASKNKLRSRKSNTTVYDIVEVGPHATLQSPVKDILSKTAASNQIRYTSLLRRNKCALTSTITAMGSLYCAGYSLNLDMINRPLCGKVKPQILSDLPEYSFDHSRTYWYESRISKNYRFRDGPRLELLGSPVSDWNPYEPRWRNFIRLSEMPWVNDHRINDQIVYPATGMLVMAIEAARKLARRPIKGYMIKEAVLSRALIISSDSEGIEVQTHLRRLGASTTREPTSFEFACYSFSDDEWHQNCHGSIVIQYEDRVSEIDGGREEAELQQAVRDQYSKAKSTCTATVSVKRMYEFLGSEMNIHYATCFQGLKELAYNDQLEAIGEVDPFDWPKLHPSGVVQDHVIHPATMDAVAQLIFVALTAGGQNPINTTVPTRIEKLWLSGKGANCTNSKSPLVLYAKSGSPTLRGTDSSVLALNKDTRELVVKIGSLQTTDLTSNSPSPEVEDDNNNKSENNLAFGFDWKPDIDHLSNSALKCYCESSWKDETTEKEFYHDLKLLLTWYIKNAVASVDAETSLPSHLAKFVKWMHWQIEKENDSIGFSTSQSESMEALANRLEATNTRGKFFVKVGQSLNEILNGKIDPLEVIFNDGLADEYYREMFDCTSCALHVGNYVDLLAHKNPSLKVLEIGGGTGGFTAHVLQPLFANGQSRYKEYMFTDISPSFFERIRDKYSSQASRMGFQTLDIEKDPKEQGFECGTYDVVVAGSVLHATADMRLTLANVRKLLKPGGKLIIFEIVKPEILRAGFVFGLLEGWWLRKEPERVHGPCMTVKTWDNLLKETGFSGTETVLRDYQDESCHETSIIVSTVCEETPVPMIESARQHLIVINPNCETQKAAASELKNLVGTQSCEIVSIDQIGKVQDLQELSIVSLVELSGPIFPEIDSETFGYLKTLLSTSNDLLWITGDISSSTSTPELEMVTGLARSLRSEKRDFKFTTLALGSWAMTGVTGISSIIKECMDSSKAADTLDNEMEFRVQDGRLCIPRMRQRTDLNKIFHEKATQDELKAADRRLADCPPVTLSVRTPGSLDSFCFVEDETCSQPLGPDEIEIEVQVVDINFMDVLTVMGQLNQDTLGGACAGYVRRIGENINDLREGDRVAACILGCMKTYARQRRELVVRIPNNMSWAEAAALPCTCVTAYQGLVEFARLRAGETILIHSGAGGTGQSAIQLAQNIEAEIFTTVGSNEKKVMLMEQYNIPEDHIFYSRDTTFAAGVMRMTQQRGVDVVLNSLSDERLTASWECMAPFGRFIEIGKKDIRGNSQLPMNPFARNVSFHCLDLASMSVYRPQDFSIALRAVMELSSTGKLTPSKPLSVYPASKIPDAFRYLQSGKNMGKTVIELGREEVLPTLLKPKKSYEFDSNALYVIAGGLGGLGRSIARWMAGRGARHLLLISRSGPKHDTHYALLDELAREGVQVYAPACDITSQEVLRETLAQCAQKAPPIKGCIQATMVLQDCIFENMSHQAWQTATRPKVQASFNLHNLLPDQLDFFILLSSVSGTIGSPAQSNYAAGNTYKDGLARHLLSKGCKAVALDLGWMASTGYVTEHERAAQNLQSAGFLAPIQQQSFLGVLEYYCDPALPITELGSGQVVLGLEMPNTLKIQGKEIPEFMFTPAYRILHMQNTSGSSKAGGNGGDGAVKSPKELLEAAESIVQATEIVADALVAKLSRTLGLDIKGIGIDKPLYEYGVDSLSALEIKNWCGKVLGANASVLELLGAESVGEVAVLVASKSKFIHVK